MLDGKTTRNGKCKLVTSPGGITYSDCTCEEVGTVVTSGTCTVSGYQYDPYRYKSMFTPDFPASSPWVTTVGATQVSRRYKLLLIIVGAVGKGVVVVGGACFCY